MRGSVDALEAERDSLVHVAMFCGSDDEYRETVGGFVRAGVAAGEPLMVAVPAARHALLGDVLAGAGDGVTFVDMAGVGANPARLIPAFVSFAATYPSQRTRLVGELMWAGRSAAELTEATLHEALLNLALAGTPMTIGCLYDVRGLDVAVLLDAARTHPVLCQDGVRWESRGYDGAHLAEAIAGSPLGGPPEDAATVGFADPEDLQVVRGHIYQQASRAGVDSARAADVMLAVGELTTNTLQHGRGLGIVRTWQERDTFVCEVCGPGHITDPLAGRTAVASATGGRGLYLVNQLCDLTEQRSGPEGTTTRVHIRTR